jgi:hypothetical protein
MKKAKIVLSHGCLQSSIGARLTPPPLAENLKEIKIKKIREYINLLPKRGFVYKYHCVLLRLNMYL